MAASSQDLTPNLVINGLGALMFLCYVAIFLRYAASRLTSVLRLLIAALLLEALLIAFFEGHAEHRDLVLVLFYHGYDLRCSSSQNIFLCDSCKIDVFQKPFPISFSLAEDVPKPGVTPKLRWSFHWGGPGLPLKSGSTSQAFARRNMQRPPRKPCQTT